MSIPLRVHGWHSLLRGVDAPRVLLARAAELGHGALALADVDTTSGLTEFLKAAEGSGVRPIVAAEISDPSGAPGRVVALVEDERGYRNLLKLVSARALGDDPGERGAALDGVERFDLVEACARFHAGLFLLVDHPRLAFALVERVPRERLLVALSVASLAKKSVAGGLMAGRRTQRAGEREARLDAPLAARRTSAAAPEQAAPTADEASAAAAIGRRRAARRSEDADMDRPERETELLPPHPSHAHAPRQESSRAASVPGRPSRIGFDEEWPELALRKTPPPARAAPAGDLLGAAQALGIAALAVPDVYFARAEGLEHHRIRAAIAANALVCALEEGTLAELPAHLLSPAEVEARYGQVPDVRGPFARSSPARRMHGLVARAFEIAEACAYVPPLGGVLFPAIDLAPGETAYSKLCALAFAGAQVRYKPLRPEVLRRLDFELSAIESLGYAPYFLLVKRIADFARAKGIPCVGRGSAADSLVAYCLALTDADPLRYRLPFERFLNPARKDRPDIDLDFCWRRRDEVLAHVAEAFGQERTAMIATLNRFGLRSAFREAALAEGVPPVEVNRWSRRLPWFVSNAGSSGVGLASAPPEGELGEPDSFPIVERAGDARTLVDADQDEHAPDDVEAEPLDADAHPFPAGVDREPTGMAHRRNEEHTPRTTASNAVQMIPATTARPDPTAAAGAPPLLVTLPRALVGNPIAHALASAPECRNFPFADSRLQRVVQAAAALVEAPRHLGLHPGGVVVAPGVISDVVACQRAAKGVVATQLDKDGVEAVGLVKMDLLGNRALTTLADASSLLGQRGIELDLAALAEDDPRTAELLAHGRTLGCFQVESPGMRHLLQQIGARCMDDVIQAVALIRPGPAGSGMKDAFVRRFRGLEEPHAPHPRLTELLRDTHGVMLYQEDVMQTVVLMAGMDLCEADELRRALAKRRAGVLERLRARYFDGCTTQGIARADAVRVWELVANFASFGFCKAHAVTYGRIAYRAVYLKAHFPADYLCAFLNSDTGYYETRVYVEEARRLGVAILPPDVNRSAREFALEEGALRVGLARVKGLSQRTLDALLVERARGGAFLALPDFLARTSAERDEVEALVLCGAFDAFDRTRPEMLWRLALLKGPERRVPHDLARSGLLDPALLAACRATPQTRARGSAATDPTRLTRGRPDAALPIPAPAPVRDGWSKRRLGIDPKSLAPGTSAPLFPEPETPALALPRLPELDATTRGRLELELLGLNVSAHPTRLFPCEGEARARLAHQRGARLPPTIPCRELARHTGERVSLIGWLAASRRVRTSNGRWMRFVTLEDETGLAEVVLFPDVYEQDGHLLVHCGPFLVSGSVEDQMGARTLHAQRVW